MADAVYRYALGAASWPVVALLFVAYLVFTGAFDKRNQTLAKERLGTAETCPRPPGEPPRPADERPTLDARGWYSAATAHEVLCRLGERGRKFYGWSEVTLDLAFPFVYGTLLAAFLVRLWAEPWGRWAVLVPLAAVVLDLLENVTIARLALSYAEGKISLLGWAAGVFTAGKTAALLLSLALVLIGAVCRLTGRPTG